MDARRRVAGNDAPEPPPPCEELQVQQAFIIVLMMAILEILRGVI